MHVIFLCMSVSRRENVSEWWSLVSFNLQVATRCRYQQAFPIFGQMMMKVVIILKPFGASFPNGPFKCISLFPSSVLWDCHWCLMPFHLVNLLLNVHNDCTLIFPPGTTAGSSHNEKTKMTVYPSETQFLPNGTIFMRHFHQYSTIHLDHSLSFLPVLHLQNLQSSSNWPFSISPVQLFHIFHVLILIVTAGLLWKCMGIECLIIEYTLHDIFVLTIPNNSFCSQVPSKMCATEVGIFFSRSVARHWYKFQLIISHCTDFHFMQKSWSSVTIKDKIICWWWHISYDAYIVHDFP